MNTPSFIIHRMLYYNIKMLSNIILCYFLIYYANIVDAFMLHRGVLVKCKQKLI